MRQSLKTRIVYLLAGLALIMLGFVAGTTVYSTLAQTGSRLATPVTLNIAPAQNIPLSDTEARLVDVYKRVSPSVVAISVTGRTSISSGEGSGFVIDQEGHIVTNFHVIDGAREIVVNFLDGTITRAEVVGLDRDSDLAVIRVSDVPAERLIPVTFGDSGALEIGQQVVAIGSPFSQRWTMTFGIVSALERTIDSFSLGGFTTGGVIQTDAPINPGNSGGPLLNLAGQVIGVNSQIRNSEGRFNAGVGFAVPSNLVARVATELISKGSVDYSYIGISGNSVGLAAIEAKGLPNNTRGVVVSDVRPGSPAAASGLRPGQILANGTVDVRAADVITAVNGEALSGMDGLISYLATRTRPGDVVTLTVLRGGQEIKVEVTLTARPTRLQ